LITTIKAEAIKNEANRAIEACVEKGLETLAEDSQHLSISALTHPLAHFKVLAVHRVAQYAFAIGVLVQELL
jgi:hypothetical protein